MKKLNLILFLLLFSIGLHAQYAPSGGLLTVLGSSDKIQENSVGAISNGRNYAISYQSTYFNGSACWRNLKFFDGFGNALATSAAYSHDHGGVTKVLFDPDNDHIAYALYQERNDASPTGGADVRTYIKCFIYSGGIVQQSNRLEVFNHGKSVDFVITKKNGILDLLVGGVKPDGSVQIQVIRSAAIMGINNNYLYGSFYTSMVGEASIGTGAGHVWPLSMANVDNVFVIAHTKGGAFTPDLKIRKYRYKNSTVSGIFLREHLVPGHKLHGACSITATSLKQSIGLRTNGEILYLNAHAPNSWTLQKLADSPTLILSSLGTGTGDANLVVSSNKMAFVARNSSPYKIDLYNEYDVLEHTYDIAWQFQNNLDNLAVLDCNLLSTGKHSSSQQYHEFYSCTDCGGDGLNADANFTNQEYDQSIPSYYGPQTASYYCGLNDVYLDGSGSTCENGYFLSIDEFDPVTWNVVTNLYSGWVCTGCTAPNNIHIKDFLPGYFASTWKTYLVTFAVGDAGGGWSDEHLFFKLKFCELEPDKGEKKKELAEVEPNSGAPQIYPNPSNGQFKVEVEDQVNVTQYRILDSRGMTVQTGEFTGATTVNTESVSAGIYMIHLVNQSGNTTQKLIIQ